MANWAGRYFKNSKGGLVLPELAALAAVALLQLAGVPQLERLGLLLFDSYQRAAPRPYQEAPVRIVDIDDESIRRLGQWPWPRTDIADLTRRIADAGAASIAYDIVFSEPDRTSPGRIAAHLQRTGTDNAALAALRALPDNDATLATAIASAPVTLGYFLGREGSAQMVEPKAGLAIAGTSPANALQRFSSAIEPLPAFRIAAAGAGFVSLIGDHDGIVRKIPLIAAQQGRLLPSLSLDALRTAQEAGSVIVKSSNASGELGGSDAQVVSLKVGQFEVPTTPAGELWLYFTPPHPARTIPAWKILTGALSVSQMQDAFGGRIVFIGTGAAGLRDLVATPLQDRELGVMVHTQAVEQMILGQYLVRPDWAIGLERSLLLGLGLTLALLLPRLGAMRGAVLGVVAVGGMLIGSWEAFLRYHYLLDPTYPVLALLLVYIVGTGVTFYREERQRAYIHRAFDRYLSPTLVKRIVDDPSRLELGGEVREMTVLFCDIRGFSAISETMGPQQIISFLIAFLTPMCDILLARQATIDKFIGDAILAFWNAPLDDPDQHANAARGALDMVARLEQMNRVMAAQTATPWPPAVEIGIGLNAGPCCVGNMGSAQRLSYSLIGDTVNLASRLEGLTKYYQVPIVIGAALQRDLGDFATLPLDRVRVVGRGADEQVFALLGDEDVAISPAFRRIERLHGEILAAYWAQRWAEALALIEAAAPHATSFGLTHHHQMLSKRIGEFQAQPPGEGWDGVYDAADK
ncbi:CHASE2 domain-containing protein [Sphingomonas sp. 28-63-12]|uniref:CHASE2 domain-containing protein n=1 Tax=Sphingomonas sp. 28-63-12 TaxID=1970434 RepID=UPI000BD947C3|nr:MAG: hypothetical protein B7Y47_14365 [Sphingomonas sp. 28-63-12]